MATADLRGRLLALSSKLDAALAAGDDGLALCRLRAEGLDAILREHFEQACGPEAAVSLVAAGSYGRGAPALLSDVDLRFISTVEESDRVAANVDAVMYPLWDVGMTVGHQVIHVADVIELARADLTTATSLLDLRHLAGPIAPVELLVERSRSELFDPASARVLVQRLEAEAYARHDRFGASVYLLEPDVKSGEGGLRDLDVFGWCRKLGPSWSWLSERENDALESAGEFLRRVRNRLHQALGRRSERLTFDAQELVAIAMGYGSADDGEEAVAAAAERMMQDYYRHARAIARLTMRAFERASAPVSAPKEERAIGRGLVEVAGEISITFGSTLAEDPALALRAYAVAMRLGEPVSSGAREILSRATEEAGFAPALRASAEAKETFVELVCDSREAPFAKGSALRELSDTGILHAMIPEFLPVTGRVHHDVYHVYTVDVHSVAAVDCLHALVRGDLRAEHPLASRLAAETTQGSPLFLATLLHDVGKGYPDANGSRKHHSERGAELCDEVLPRLGLSEDEVADARALVANHLVMYHLATRRDLDDARTIEELARVVRGREGLRDLYLLTVADITTTAPTAMTSWKAHVLEELYLRADAHMSGVADHERTERLERAAARLWDGPREELVAFIASMPMRWRIATTPAACVVHKKTCERAEGGVKVEVVEQERARADHVDLCVVAPDRTGLLARIAAALTANRLEVLAAQIYSRKDRGGMQAVDVFSVRHPQGLNDAIAAVARVESDLSDLTAGRTTPLDLILARTGSSSPWRDRPTPAVPVEIVFDEHASSHATVVEVFAKDQPGLLFRLAQALADLGLSIVQSRINTEGTKVTDVFYVHEASGTKVTGLARKDEIRSRLRQAVQN